MADGTGIEGNGAGYIGEGKLAWDHKVRSRIRLSRLPTFFSFPFSSSQFSPSTRPMVLNESIGFYHITTTAQKVLVFSSHHKKQDYQSSISTRQLSYVCTNPLSESSYIHASRSRGWLELGGPCRCIRPYMMPQWDVRVRWNRCVMSHSLCRPLHNINRSARLVPKLPQV